jgi:aspartate/tyrosine/aromatic aminotransferase
MFESVATAPPDSILGLTEAFLADPNPRKINLSVGVYKDEHGKTPVLATVKAAEQRLLATETSKNYVPIDGTPAYAAAVQELIFGPGHEAVATKRCVTAHTPGGTGALRVAADYVAKLHKLAVVWLPEPTWPNHRQVFEAAGIPVKTYPYFNPAANSLAFADLLAALGEVEEGDLVLLHGCCHNPTGIDPTAPQWQAIAELLAEKAALPLVDFAYQGLGDGLRQDAAWVQAMVQPGRELLIASSFSKNFGLYNERVGALTVVASGPEPAAAVLSQIKACIRVLYSNPPAHGGAIVTAILGDPVLRPQWEAEVAAMRTRIQDMRHLFVATLAAKGVKSDHSFIERQKGMFSFSGLTKEQVEQLRRDYALYIVGSGRINVAGMTRQNMDALCTAIAAVM